MANSKTTIEDEAEELTRNRVPLIYNVIQKEGEEELARPVSSLFLSGLSAGLAIFLSVIAIGAIFGNMPNHAHYRLIESFGYTVGFVVVIFGRLQLFTENTITVIIPLLANYSHRRLRQTLLLWGVVFLANMIGVAIVSAVSVYTNLLPTGLADAIVAVSQEYINRSPTQFFMHGIPAGFIIAAIVWMLPSAESNKFAIIVMLSYLIYLGDFTHVIAGAGEVFVMVFKTTISISDAVFKSIIPTLFGNIIGGTLLFSMLAYGQVREEL